MNISTSPNIPDLKIIEPTLFNDSRGYFFESYNKEKYLKNGIASHFLQDNQSKSTKGVLRGLHMQIGQYAQAKLVRVLQGKVWDVAVDMREDSSTYLQYYGLELSQENQLQFFIPRGFAHGFLVLTDTAIFSYKCDNYYNKESESGVHYASPSLNINWPKIDTELIISEKDLNLPLV